MRLETIFAHAPFVERLGLRVVEFGVGWLVTGLDLADWHRQQHGFVHAGVLATMVDHTQGGAASTVIEDGQSVLTAEFKINLLMPGNGPRLTCRGEVLRSGRRLIVTKADAFDGNQLIATSLATMAVTSRPLG